MMWSNTLKTVILLSLLSALLLFLGNLLGGQEGIALAFIFALISNGIAYFFADKLVLRMYKAQPLDRERYGFIYEIIDELSIAMHIPQPKLWLIPTSESNAFATGRNPKNASIAVTQGILHILDEHELRGVLAHELSHIKNRDILVGTIAATFASAISFLTNMIQRAAWWGHYSNDKKNNSINMAVALLIAIIMPFIALLIQLAISRSREYLADETGAQACHDPLALASALEKLHMSKDNTSADFQADPATAHLFIVNPLKGASLQNLFSTHPPVEKRIERLKRLSIKEMR